MTGNKVAIYITYFLGLVCVQGLVQGLFRHLSNDSPLQSLRFIINTSLLNTFLFFAMGKWLFKKPGL